MHAVGLLIPRSGATSYVSGCREFDEREWFLPIAMRSRPTSGPAVVAIVVAALIAQAAVAHPGSAYDSPGLPEVAESKAGAQKGLVLCGLAKSDVSTSRSRKQPAVVPIWAQEPESASPASDDALWEARYLLYQELISQGSSPLFRTGDDYLEAEDGTPVCLLHGRSDVLNNADLIRRVAGEYPDIAPVMVAAAIAEQASDVERIFGLDILEQTTLFLPGKENMSVGIAQIRPTEAVSLGIALDPMDLFDPEIAVRGMVAKLKVTNERIDAYRDPEVQLSLTERYMVLSLGQNSPGIADDYYAAKGDWAVLLGQNNNARVMRYFLVHLDWLLANGWELPEDVDLDFWRKVAFSSPQEVAKLDPGNSS